MSRIIAVANQKGGVGKTTTTVNLSASLASKAYKVLVIDIDPQGNATSGLGIDKLSAVKNVYDVFSGEGEINDCIVQTEIHGLFVLPANGDLVGAEIELVQRMGRENILRDQLAKIEADYDYILIDCPPSLGLLTVNALTAADSLLVPLQSEYYALEGISSLMHTMEVAKQALNKRLTLEGVVLTMYDARTNLSRQIETEARTHFQDAVFRTVIPRNIKLSESPSFGKPILLYDPNSIGAIAYKALADELVKKHLGSTNQFQKIAANS
jgi:chromosome partitioning protein